MKRNTKSQKLAKLLSLGLLLFSLNLMGQTKAEQIDALMQKYFEYNKFHGSVLVADQGEVLYKNGFGYANIEWQIPNAANTKHRLGSITKQFTAMLILQLAEEGKLDLQAPIATYLPDYPKPYADQITIHMLLTHTSGIPNYTSIEGLVRKESRNYYSPEDFIAFFSELDLDFEPGSQHNYSNSGYFPVEELATFRKLDSRLQGHPATHEGLPGVRIASGSLGQGLSVACGVAQAKKLDQDGKSIFCLMGDGELQEGQIWEAVMYAAHNKIDNLVGIVDWNGRQIDGDNDDVLSLGDLKGKWESFGWSVTEVDGNNMEALVASLEAAKANTGNGKPQVILMRTEMGHPIDFMVGSHKWHGVAPNAEQTEQALAQLEETMGDYPYPA